MNLHPAFEKTSHALGELPLCHVRLHDDSRWPWLVLIPRLEGLREIEDLGAADRARLMDEAVLAGAAVRAIGEAMGFAVAKLNLGALGNITPQLHLHVIGRREGDAAWPGPVWGVGESQPYRQDELTARLSAGRLALRL